MIQSTAGSNGIYLIEDVFKEMADKVKLFKGLSLGKIGDLGVDVLDTGVGIPLLEREREKAAEHKLILATAYVIGASRSYPIMQLDFKENVQNMTNGKVYVKLAPGGQLGK